VTRRPALLALGVVLAVGLPALSACSSSSASAGGGSGASSTSTAAAKTITVSYSGGQVSPPPGRVDVAVGTHVHLVVTSDVAEEVHNHYDNEEKEVAPGGTVTFDFVVEQPGVYEVELHHSNKQLLQLQVQ
jgi:plastocyanin